MSHDAKLPANSAAQARHARYAEVRAAIASLLSDEDDWIAAMATVASELRSAFAYYDWVGFYRAVSADLLVIGPYQGGHGCLRITHDRGVCGAAARTRTTQRVDDVEKFAGHIACSSTTRSELVIPVVTPAGKLLGVLDVDSDTLAAFTEVDEEALEALCKDLGEKFGDTHLL